MCYQGAYKIVILGSGAVGKTALTIRLVTDNFLDDYDPTIEDLYTKTLSVDNEAAPIEVLDTAGQEEFLPMQDEWIRSSRGIVLVYSVTDRQSFEAVEQFRQKVMRIKESERYVPLVLVGNKCDLEDMREVSTDEGTALAESWSTKFFETSAKIKVNNTECFNEIIREIRKADEIDREAEKKNNTTFLQKYCNIL
jgi:GTPase KRas